MGISSKRRAVTCLKAMFGLSVLGLALVFLLGSRESLSSAMATSRLVAGQPATEDFQDKLKAINSQLEAIHSRLEYIELARGDRSQTRTNTKQSVSNQIKKAEGGQASKPNIENKKMPDVQETAKPITKKAEITTKTKVWDKINEQDKSTTKHQSENSKSEPGPGAKVTRYIVYVCDDTCYGLGDRQRAIVSLYYLSVVTNRTLIINMTSPANFIDFYKPNNSNWLTPKDNFKGKSSVKLKAFGNDFLFRWDTDDFNKKYPQEVVYITTNQNFYIPLQKNPLYKPKLPLVTRYEVHSKAWLQLMQPTDELRNGVNEQLIKIAQAQRKEQAFHTTDKSKQCKTPCRIAFSNNTLWKPLENQVCDQSQRQNISGKNSSTSFEPCSFPTPQFTTRLNDDLIRKTKGFDNADLDLVCVHVRIGYSKTMTREPIRNKWEHLPVLWKFLEPYVTKGQHLYLATDSQQVRDLALSAFGPRVHMSDVQITHSDQKHAADVARKGFKLSLVEQLILSTSCKTLIISKSNFSVRAGMLRRFLMKEDSELFVFRNGGVHRTNAWYLF